MSKKVALDRLRDISRPRSLREPPAAGRPTEEERTEAVIVEWPIKA